MTALKYQHSPDMGEISGFGGGYEEMCQRMLDAGLRWLDEHPDSDPQFGGFKGVFGLITETNDDARALNEAVLAVCRDCTGAMHQAVIQRCLYVKANGWEKYCAELRASTAGPGENAGGDSG